MHRPKAHVLDAHCEPELQGLKQVVPLLDDAGALPQSVQPVPMHISAQVVFRKAPWQH
jgi:hypothetical protein